MNPKTTLFHKTDNKNFMILAYVILIGSQSETDKHTNAQTDASALAKMHPIKKQLKHKWEKLQAKKIC